MSHFDAVPIARRFHRHSCHSFPISLASLAVYRPLNMSLILIHIYPTVLLRSSTNASTFVPLATPLLICNGLRAVSCYIMQLLNTHAVCTLAANV